MSEVLCGEGMAGDSVSVAVAEDAELAVAEDFTGSGTVVGIGGGDSLRVLARVFIDRRFAVGVAGRVEDVIVEPAEGLSLPLILIAVDDLRLAQKGLCDRLVADALPIEDPRIGRLDIVMVLDEDIVAIGGYVGGRDEVEASALLVLGIDTDVGAYAKVADIGERLCLVTIIRAERQAEDLADIVIDLGDDVEDLVAVVIHECLVVVASAIGIDIVNLRGGDCDVTASDGGFFEIEDAIEIVVLVVVSEGSDEEIVRAVIDSSAEVFPVPVAYAVAGVEVDLLGFLLSGLVGGDDMCAEVIALHPDVSGCDA